MESWWVGLDAWVLEDGNYPDFVTGERRQFALELGYDRSDRLVPLAGAPARTCRHTGRGARYRVSGQLLRAATEPMTDAFVLDVGVLAYTQWLVLDDLQPPAAGDWLTGEIALAVDPFMYRDELAARPGMPPLAYTWTVEEVQLRAGDAWQTVPRTRVWEDEGGYRLRCRLDGGPVSP